MKQRMRGPVFQVVVLLLLANIMPLIACCNAESGILEVNESTDSHMNIYTVFLSDADVFIEIPALRQYGGYTCGATCVQMIMNWLYPYEGDMNLMQYEEQLGTTPESGTSPDAITGFLEENGVEFTASEQLSLIDLRNKLDEGHPVMVALQAWSSAEDGSYNVDDPSDSETYLAEGHWVICVGYCESADRPYFIFNDPACVGNNIIYADEFDRRWIDMDGAGTIYDHFGIEINQGTEYDGNGLFYMN